MSDEIQETLQYSDDWVELGIITPSVKQAFWKEWQATDDQNPEHYRWRAFTKFLKPRKTVSPELLRKLYELGTRDVDPSMGGSMMVEVLRHPDCPSDLLEKAQISGEQFLIKAAGQILVKRNSEKA